MKVNRVISKGVLDSSIIWLIIFWLIILGIEFFFFIFLFFWFILEEFCFFVVFVLGEEDNLLFCFFCWLKAGLKGKGWCDDFGDIN